MQAIVAESQKETAIIDPRGVVIAAASADREELIHAD